MDQHRRTVTRDGQPVGLSRKEFAVLAELLRADGGVVSAELGTNLLAVNERHERLIDGLLTLASSEQGFTDPAPVDLADIAQHICTESQAAARGAGIEIHADLRPAPVTGDPVLLERLTQNLVDKAIRYNLPAHGKITMIAGIVDDRAYLTVDNTGPLIPPYEVPDLFEPFRRLRATERLADSITASSPGRGAGLGLSIVRSVARTHGRR